MAILIGSGTLGFVGVIWLLFYVMIFVMLAWFFLKYFYKLCTDKKFMQQEEEKAKRLDKGLF